MTSCARLPEPAGDWSFFLDFDGTLAEIAAHPDQVEIRPGLPALLRDLHRALGGAVAVVSGRPIAVLDALLGAGELPCAGLHGLELRWPDGRRERVAAPTPALARAKARLAAFAGRHPGLHLEDKDLTVALHYRGAPALEEACRRLVAEVGAALPGYRIMRGKKVLELKPGAADKGSAIRTLMRDPAFAGRVPVFAGDDTTDEDGFAVVAELGGITVKVGEGATRARYRVPDVGCLLEWLEDARCRLSS